ncbi:hypothetical protein KUTeg_014064 [Tegillarca granosa]|uniref:Tetratricopeptide repeat protein 7 N-terminal domain-containing protein n=1 Tax=Tegillarca granosa TaxID=220873 RepID=A0ABQ9EZC4_TEGGR|nr:hypothetical protein KUTeg_014064 [Tegillarca granosa]
MSAKPKYFRLESEIEKYRVDANWSKALDVARQLASKSQGLGMFIIYYYYVSFLLGESKLEEYLKDNAPEEKNIVKAKAELHDAEKYLTEVAQKDTKILAEAYAIKGICLEKLGPASTSKFRVAELEEKVIGCFEKAGDLALLYLQERERNASQTSTASTPTGLNVQDDNIGIILETVIQRSPILYIKKGEISKGVHRFRELLRVVEVRFTQGLRQTLARHLAEVLLRGMCESNYVTVDLNKSESSKTSTLKPRKYSGERVFIPRDQNEETLLLLLIAEAIATREAVLNRSEELEEARLQSVRNTMAVYDLLAITLVKRAQFNKLCESLERALRFSFEEFHIWYQFANSLICAGKYSRAVLVLKECARLKPKNIIILLQAAKLCYEYLHQYDEGIKLAEQALEVSENHPMAARVHLALGVGYSMKAMEMRLQTERQELHKKALNMFTKAHMLDPNDYLALFHLALQLAILRQVVDAVKYVRLALKYRSDHIHSLHLLVLLLSAQKQHGEAMTLINAALEEYPDNLSLLLTKSKLEEILYGPDQALNTCRHMLALWKDLYETDTEDFSKSTIDTRSRRGNATDRMMFDRKNFAQLQLSELNDRDSGSIRAESIAASRVEQTLSDLASSMNSTFLPRPGSQQTWLLQAQIWLHLAELYLTLDKMSEAEACVQETSVLFPLSHQVAYMKGRVFEHKQRYQEAKCCYENAISINPGHTKSLQHLGMVFHNLDNNKMAEKVLRDAVNTDPTSHNSWYMLGLVLETLGQAEAAMDCHYTALSMEATSPVVPFSVIPRLMQ